MRKVVLCILDGFGLSDKKAGNAILNANIPNYEFLWNTYPHSKLIASGKEVGLPDGQMGNSEVGHLNIGAGRIVYQPLELINNKIKDGTFFQNESILNVYKHVKQNNSKLHIFGLLSDGGVHSHIDHLFALIDMCKKEKIENVYYHVFLDGRDTLPNSSEKYLKLLESKISQSKIGSIASISGRYYAMDRDNRWERIKKVYDVVVNAQGEKYDNYFEFIEANKKRELSDEFMMPALIDENGCVSDNDGLIVFNFRPDRLRELFSAISNSNFAYFKTKKLHNLKLVTMMGVSDEVICDNAFALSEIKNTLGEFISQNGMKQLRIAETEKYAHVTYFFDGGEEIDLKGCTRKLIPSPKVSTYDLKPEMSASEITEVLIKDMNKYDLIIVNFANADMVGHTGNFEAAIKAVETIDKNLGKIHAKCEKNGFTLIVTADHGNLEEMIDEDGNPKTSHTTNLVPFIVCDKKYTVKDGKLSDVAPTVLEIMGFNIPRDMSGERLID